MKSKFVALALSLFLSQSVLAGGVGLSSTRVIYDGSKKEASLTVQNKSKTEEFLIQS
ncbi:fimbria/pilus periplasmic chaperone, partial [Escherichia coli O157]|nr:fimbria/pilus periplasmic chaperone [Escherichia coli O157]